MFERVGDLLEIEPQHPTHGHRRQRRTEMMPAPDGHMELAISHTERQPAALGADVGSAKIATFGVADPGNRGGALPGHLAQKRIVAQNGTTAGRQCVEQFHLGVGNPSPAAKTAQMGVTHTRNHTDLRHRQPGQRGDLARPTCAQLQHRIIVLRLDGRHTQRDAVMVVEVLRTGRTAKPRLQYGVDHLPRGGFSGAAGDGNHGAGKPTAFPPRPGQQRLVGVLDTNDPLAVGHQHVFGHHGAGGPASKCLVDKCFTRVVRSPKRPKHVTRLDLPTVTLHGAQWRNGYGAEHVASTQPAANRVVEFGNR